jgi:long-subunit acyl-CoA synthetase (AMP-forming)
VDDPANPGKTFEKLHLASEYTWLTYNDLSAKVEAFATGLVTATGVSKGEPVVIYAETKADWMVRHPHVCLVASPGTADALSSRSASSCVAWSLGSSTVAVPSERGGDHHLRDSGS